MNDPDNAKTGNGQFEVETWVAKKENRRSRRSRSEHLLRIIAKGTAGETGTGFFRSLVRYLASALRVRYAFIAEFLEDGVSARILAFYAPTGYIYDRYEFSVLGTPCEDILRGRVSCYSRNVRSLFPGDQGLAELNAESYLAIPLTDPAGKVLGHLAVIDTKPLQVEVRDLSVFNIFAARAAAELLRQQTDRALVASNDRLSQSLSALKALQTQLIQSEKMTALGILVAGLTHEINNPIGAIKGAVDVMSRCRKKLENGLLSEGQTEKETRQILHVLQENEGAAAAAATKLSELVLSLKNFSRLDESAFKKADIHEGLESTLSLLKPQMNREITVIKDFGKIPRIGCYPGELNQVFMNILFNAKQSIEGRGTIRIKTSSDEGYVNIRISDSGKGIPTATLPKIFDPGFTTKGVGVGAGMGLPISYNIVEKHRGTISVNSEVGKGTEFTISLPIS